jgi:flagellar protein FliJ
MKRFRFPLRPVAVLRAHHEARAREAFAAAVHAYVLAEENLAAARERAARLAAALCAGRRERFDAAGEAHSLHGYRREAAAELAAERAVIAAREAMQRRRADYLEAHRKVEVVSRLEARARRAHWQAAQREEQTEFDEFGARRRGHALASAELGPARDRHPASSP